MNLSEKNRDVLKRLIDIVCVIAVHELPFRGHNEGEDSLNKGVYLGLIELLSTYDAPLSNHLETSRIFRGTSNRIQNDIILTAGEILLKKIKQEITQSTFVAMLLDKTSDIMNSSQLSTTLQYVNSETGKVHLIY